MNSIEAFVRRHFSKDRGGRAKLAISTSVLARIFTTVIGVSLLPITIRYLGNEGYGLLVTITSVVGWLQFSNMGLGLGLQNALIEETGKGNRVAQKELVSTTAFALGFIGMSLIMAGAAVFPFVDWEAIFRPSTETFVSELRVAIIIVYLGFISTIILGFIGPIYASRQEIHIGSIQSIVIALLSFLGTIVVVCFDLGLIGVVVSTIGVTTLVQWGFALWTLYGRGLTDLRPSFACVSWYAWNRIFKTSLYFVLLQICGIVFYQIDAILITQFLSLEEVTPYSIAQKIFLMGSGLFAIVTGSLWAAYGNAKAKGDVCWIVRTHKRVVRTFCFFFGILSTFMVLFGTPFLLWWVGVGSAPPAVLIAAVAFSLCAREWVALNAMLLNGLNLIRQQVPAMVSTSILAVALEVLFIRWFGTVGLAVGGGTGFLLVAGLYMPYLTRNAFRNMIAGKQQ